MAVSTVRRHEDALRAEEPARGVGDRAASGNRVKSRPAKDAVINGILSQLGSLDAPRNDNAARHTAFTRPDFSDFDQGSRPQSPAESFAGAPIVPFSPSNAVRLGAENTIESEDEAFDDVAAPPVIPITRSPMRLSQQTTPRSLSYGGSQQEDMGSSASSSKRASLVPSSKDSQRVSHQSSAESWNKPDQISPAGKRRTLRRVESHDTLRMVEPDNDFHPDQDFIFNGLGSLATNPPPIDDTPFRPSRRTSPKPLGKSRLYLQESIEDLQETAAAADLAVKPADNASIKSDRSRGSSAGPSTPVVSKLRGTPKPSAISDSIPLRTSSLRLSSSPASTKRKSRIKANPRTGSLARTISEEAQEETWAELGDDDETVRRIKELRKKRESRMLSEDISARSTRASSSQTRELSQVRSASITSQSAFPNKAAKILGLDAPKTNSAVTKDPAGNGANSLVGTDRKQLMRPITPSYAAAPERPLSLDYSYALAIDALQSASNNTSPQRRSQSRSRQAQRGMSAVRPIGFQHRRTTSNTSTNASPARLKKQRGRPAGSQFDDGDEKGRNRRKSMSDARRPGDEGGELQRRDSVENAVLEYLNDPRLSQYVLDPQTKRKISFSEVGDPRGAAVLVCVGMGLTRFVTAFFDELATTLRLRLITIERPGVGGSEPYPMNDRSGPLMWASDVTTVTDYLGVSKFSMLAHSAGAVYALGTALTLPHYVRGSIHLLAPWIPPSQLEAVSFPSDNAIPVGVLPRSQRILRVLPAPFLRMANNSYVFSSLKPDKRKSGSAPADSDARTSSESQNRCKPRRPATSNGARPESRARPENPRRESLMLMDQFMPETNPMENFPLSSREGEKSEIERRRSSVFLGATINPNDPSFTFAGEALNAAEHSARERQTNFSSTLTQRTWEYAIKDSNPATDLLVCLERNREIGFRYTDVVRRVIITHGSEDKRVPVGNVKWLANQMNRAVITRYAVSRETVTFDPGAEPGCELRVLQNEGHGLMASPIIMADILTEIAGYWTAEERGRRPSQNL